MQNGISGKIAGTFIRSKLTLLLTLAGILLGIYSVIMIPREEDPQIKVPMVDILIGYPGGSPKEVETKVTAPMEKIISNIKGVEHIYSTSMDDQATFIVQFYVGEDVEASQVKLYSELLKNSDQLPENATVPMLKLRSIDDVPILGLTLWSEHHSDAELRTLGNYVSDALKKTPEVSDIKIIGGRKKAVNVLLDKSKMQALNIDLFSIQELLVAQNIQLPGGILRERNRAISIKTGPFLTSAEEVGHLIIGTNANRPVFLNQVAEIEDGLESPSQYVTFSYGGAEDKAATLFPANYPAVTLAVNKKSGADAMALTKRLENQVERLQQTLIPSDVQVSITRNTGESASEKVSELLLHLAIAVIAVTAFVTLAMGWRGGMVVFLSVPVTFALTLMSYYFLGYTLNRITLFALVFIVGIVVDDSIIIAENMHRHFKLRKLPFLQAAIFSINEVGNPTILATFTVISAVLPMAFVSGMMGPYMSPMPIGAAVAMFLSLIVALTLTPYLGYLFLREKDSSKQKKSAPPTLEEGRLYKIYDHILHPLFDGRGKRWAFMIVTAILLLFALSFFYFNWVRVKMLPFDNKNEFQIVIDLPEGSTLEQTQAATLDIAAYLDRHEMVTDYQTYVGTASPITFNGLVRHYDWRTGDQVGDIQVHLIKKEKRKPQSHTIVSAMRKPIQQIAGKYDANVKFVEISPGPPVMATLLAEVYGPDDKTRLELAGQIKNLLAEDSSVVDLDWNVEADQPEYTFLVDKEKAMRRGVASQQVAYTVNGMLSGLEVGSLHQPQTYEPIPIRLKLGEKDKAHLFDLDNFPIKSKNGTIVPLEDLGQWKKGIRQKSITRKDQKPSVFIMADLAGKFESPIYAMAHLSDRLKEIQLPPGYELQEEYTQAPKDTEEYTLKWDGEWQITYEVFRDLGMAFGVVLILIYILIVGWFQNFMTPLVVLSAIPLSLIGIIIGHWAFGAYFTATSMIGFIALAGVMVRNSILLIDFINIRLKQGEGLKQAIIEAGAVRTTPILLTAGAVIIGAVIILFDPVFQGLALSLIGGTLTSTFLTLLVVPLLYFKLLKKKYKS